MINEIKIGETTFSPDTHCVDADTGLDVWSFSPGLVREMLAEIDKGRLLLQRDHLLAALEPLRGKFRSGNCIPVERSVITAKEWLRVEYAIAAVEQPCAKPSADANGWIKWHGGERPVPGDTIVQIKMRNGVKYSGLSKGYRWINLGTDGDIIAYRVVQEGGAAAALTSREAEIERLRHALELAGPVMEAHAGPSRLAEFVSAGRTAQAARRSVVDWAKQAGFDPGTPAVVDWLSRFATIVDSAVRSEAMAAEREACAKVCDKEAVRIVIDSPEERAYNNAVSDCAAAIRARGEK